MKTRNVSTANTLALSRVCSYYLLVWRGERNGVVRCGNGGILWCGMVICYLVWFHACCGMGDVMYYSDDGYKLTYLGYDYLAIKTLVQRGLISGVGRRIGVGKESGMHACCERKSLFSLSHQVHARKVKLIVYLLSSISFPVECARLFFPEVSVSASPHLSDY